MRILTYNIWFENISAERINDVIDVICETDAEIVCLQEVTQQTEQMIVESDKIKQKYFMNGGCFSQSTYQAFYKVMILSKYPCVFHEYLFDQIGRAETAMGR